MRLLLIILMSIMAGCTTTVPNGTPSSNVVAAVTKATPHPVEPNWVTFTRKPVVREVKIGDEKGFIVTDQFVERSLQLQEYQKRVKNWKLRNLIP